MQYNHPKNISHRQWRCHLRQERDMTSNSWAIDGQNIPVLRTLETFL